MSRIPKHICLGSRLVLLLLLLSCLSPGPKFPSGKPEALVDLYSNVPGNPSIVIWKSHYTVTLYKGTTPVKTYRAVFGKGHGNGDKMEQGDKRTPEGEFYICTMNHSKRFYKFMGLSYPDWPHAKQGFQNGLITTKEYAEIEKALAERRQPPWDTRLGGAVGIHGRMLDAPSGGTARGSENWTDGCIALANTDVDEIFGVVSLGTTVIILP